MRGGWCVRKKTIPGEETSMRHEGSFWGCVCCEEMTWLNNNSTVVQFQKLFNKQFLCLHLNLTFSSSRWGRGNKRKWSEFEGQILQEMSSRKGHACPLALLWMAILLTHWRGKQIWGVTNAAVLPNRFSEPQRCPWPRAGGWPVSWESPGSPGVVVLKVGYG